MAADLTAPSLNQDRENFLRKPEPYNPIKTRLDRYMSEFFSPKYLYNDSRPSTVPIAKEFSFEKIVDLLSRSVSQKISLSNATVLHWEPNDASGSDFGVFNEEQNGTRNSTDAELKWARKSLGVFPVFNPAEFNPDNLKGLRHVAISASVGLEVGAWWDKKMSVPHVELELIEHPVTKEIIIVSNNMGIGCSNCTPDILRSFSLSESELVVEVQSSFNKIKELGFSSWLINDYSSVVHSYPSKLVVKLNGSLDLRVYRNNKKTDRPYEYFYATGGSPVIK